MSHHDARELTEPVHYGCVIPSDLLYDVEMDVWIRLEGDVATIGMTDPAQTRCGKLVVVHFRKVGKEIKRGRHDGSHSIPSSSKNFAYSSSIA